MTKTLIQLAKEHSERNFKPVAVQPSKASPLHRRIEKVTVDMLAAVGIRGPRRSRNIRIVRQNLDKVIHSS